MLTGDAAKREVGPEHCELEPRVGALCAGPSRTAPPPTLQAGTGSSPRWRLLNPLNPAVARWRLLAPPQRLPRRSLRQLSPSLALADAGWRLAGAALLTPADAG